MAALEPVGEMLQRAIVHRAPYPAPVHSWAGWQPKGPARRLTGAEVAVRVYGRGGPDDAAFGAFAEIDCAMLYGKP